MLSDAEETLKRRADERGRDPLSFSFSFTFPAEKTADKTSTAAAADETAAILTVNSVSNPAGTRRSDRSPAPTTATRSTERSLTRATSSSSQSQRRYSFDDDSQQFDWSATLNLLSRLDDGQASTTTTRREPVDADRRRRADAARTSLDSAGVERSTSWRATLPAYSSGKRTGAAVDSWRSPTPSGQRDGDFDVSSEWLERQRRTLQQRRSAGTPSASSTSTVKARIVLPPARTELERRLIDELKTSQERLNVDRGRPNGLYPSYTLPARGPSLPDGLHNRSFPDDVGRYSTLPGRIRAVSGGGGGVQRANSELDFRADSLMRRGQSSYGGDDVAFDRHRSLTSLRGGGGDSVVERNFINTTVSRRTGALNERSYRTYRSCLI